VIHSAGAWRDRKRRAEGAGDCGEDGGSEQTEERSREGGNITGIGLKVKKEEGGDGG
jgi:hypothetical protein